MKRTKELLLSGLLLLSLLLSGCRVRILSDPAGADEHLVSSQAPETSTQAPTEPTIHSEPPETQAPESTAPSEHTEAPETEAPETEPIPSPTVPAAPAPPSNPTGSQGGEGGQGAAQPVPVPSQAPETLSPSLTLTLDDNGGDTGLMRLSLSVGEPYGILPEPSRRGWRFDGWWTEPSGGRPIGPEDPVETQEDHTLYAHWAPGEAYTLHLDPAGGRLSLNDRSLPIRPGDPYGQLPSPIREGYEFLGWWTDPDEGRQIDPEELYELTQDSSLYAHWQYNPLAYWSFYLQNSKLSRYDCQKLTVYVETQAEGQTIQYCSLIEDTDSFNAAANREDPQVDDEWVEAKGPAAIVKCVASMAEAEQAKAALAARFPGLPIFAVSPEGLGGGTAGLYARLALCKYLYPAWYTDLDLSQVAVELGLGSAPLQ